MATAIQNIVKFLRRESFRENSDHALIAAFAERKDEAAFSELVRRHGSFVLGVCQRVLGNVADAEDAFQATFLVLARKASSITWRDSIKGWLHSVAVRISMKARVRVARRRSKEAEAATSQRTVDGPAECWSDVRAILDEELDQIPAKCRAVLLLCYLEGKTRDEAADELGWSAGSVKGYLERGRDLLRARLVRRGLPLSAALVTGLLTAPTTVSAALGTTTTQCAVQFVGGSVSSVCIAKPVLSLAQETLNAMILTKIKVLGAVAAALVCAFSAMIGIHQALAEAPPIDPPMVEQHEVAEIKAPAVVAVILQDKNPQPKGKKSEVPGIVKAIDLKMGTLTLTFTGDGKRGDQQFNLRALDMKVPTSLGLLLKLSELPIGTRIHVQLISEDITAIRADHPTMAVSFANVDADKKTITVRAERGSDTYQVGDNAKITLNGKPGKLAEVPTNQKCFVTLSLDRKTVLVLTAGRAPRDGEVGKGRVQKTTGVISKVEGDKVTVTIAGDNGERTANFTITKETSILIETDQNKTSEGKTTDLRAGQRVTITTDQGAGVVTVLVLQTPKQLKDSK